MHKRAVGYRPLSESLEELVNLDKIFGNESIHDSEFFQVILRNDENEEK